MPHGIIITQKLASIYKQKKKKISIAWYLKMVDFISSFGYFCSIYT